MDLLEARGSAEEAGLDLSGGYVLAEPHTHHQVKLAYAGLAEDGFDVGWITAEEVRRLCGGRGFTGGGYRIEGGGSLDPAATTKVLMRAAEDAGARIIEDVDVIGTEANSNGVVCRADGA